MITPIDFLADLFNPSLAFLPRNVLAKAREAFYASVDSVVISELTAGARPVGPVFVELGFAPPENALPVR